MRRREHGRGEHHHGQAGQVHEQGAAVAAFAKHHAGAQHYGVELAGIGQAAQAGFGGQLGAGVARGAAFDAQGRDLHHAAHASLGAGLEQGAGGVLVHGVNGARGAVAQYAHGIDHGVNALQARQPSLGRGVAGKVHGHLVWLGLGLAAARGRPGVHLVPGGAQGGMQGLADESGGAGQKDVHGGVGWAWDAGTLHPWRGVWFGGGWIQGLVTRILPWRPGLGA
jgi:hypothetical protein